MGYGITSTSQIIDISAIENGCNQIKQYVADFDACGSLVVIAGENCTEKALAIDENTFQYSITGIGEEISKLKDGYIAIADQVIAEARQVYNAQMAEYQAYQQQLQQQQNNNNN